MPAWLLMLLCGHALLSVRGGVWAWSFLPHGGVYVLAAGAAVLPPSRLTRWLASPLFIGTVCAGFLVGLLRFLRGRRAASWESPR
jgi:hypothetical protein